MKKLFTLTAFALISVVSFAATFDIIVTTDEQRIEAQIVEVSKSEIKYKEIDNPDGPTFILSTNDLSSIIFSNGQIKVYEHSKSSVTQNEIQPLDMVHRTGNSYHYKGEKMRGKSYEFFLKNNCADAYNLYREGYMLSIMGWGLLACGLFFDLGLSWWRPTIGVIGLACEIACIPTLCVGYARMHSSADIFNATCANKKPQVYLSFNASPQNGLGLALNF